MMSLSVAMALSGLEADHWTEELRAIYNHGIALIDDKNLSPLLTTATESGMGPQGAEYANHKCPTLDLNMNEYTEERNNNNYSNINAIIKTERNQKPTDDLKIMYDNRNVLLLNKNLEDSWKIQYATLDSGVKGFFENRSQYSRLADVEPPPSVKIICAHDDCQFEIPHYF